jgi:hypothetical protein
MAESGTARLTAALAGAGVSWDRVAGCRRLTGGTFNAVHLVSLADGTRLVVKIPPGPDTPLLRYEQRILGTEALYYRVAGQCRDVTVPAVVAVETTGAAGGYLVMTERPGSPWPELAPRPSGTERDKLRAALGGQVARLHTISGTGFGYPSGAVGPLRETRHRGGLPVPGRLPRRRRHDHVRRCDAAAALALPGLPLPDHVGRGGTPPGEPGTPGLARWPGVPAARRGPRRRVAPERPAGAKRHSLQIAWAGASGGRRI